MIAGYVLSRINQFCIDNKLKTKPVSFIHDSLEFDIHPSEFFLMTKQIVPLMNNIPKEEFGIPSKADLTFGLSMGDENTVLELECDDNYNEGTVKLEGFEDDLDALYENWKPVYSEVSYEDEGDPQEQYIPMKEIFMPKLTISKYTGTSRRIITRKFHIKIK